MVAQIYSNGSFMYKSLITMSVLIFLSLFADISLASKNTCEFVKSECIESGNKTLVPENNSSAPAFNVSTACWNEEQTWKCTTGDTVSTCDSNDIKGCSLAKNKPIETNSKGEAIAWRQSWVCEHNTNTTCVPNTTSIDELENDSFCSISSEVCNNELGSYCIDKKTSYICQEPSKPCIVEGDDESCELINTECTSSASGKDLYGCLNEEQTWECSSQTETCKEVSVVNTCSTNMDKGLSDYKQADHSSKLAGLASGMQVAKAIENDISGDPPTIFGGNALHCTRTLIGDVVGKNCCSTSTTSGSGGLGECEGIDEQTAIARKANRAHHVVSADHVRQYIDLMVGGFCSFTEKKRQYYCGFDSLLAKIIQIQGREQLRKIAENSTASGAATLDFKYASGSGSWNTVNFAGYKGQIKTYPGRCTSKTAAELSECPDSLESKLKIKGHGENIERNVSVYKSESVALSRNVLIMPGKYGTICDLDVDSRTYGNCQVRLKAWGGAKGSITAPATIVSSRYTDRQLWSPISYGGQDWEFQIKLADFKTAPIPDNDPVTFRWRIGANSAWKLKTLPSPLSPDDGMTIGGAPVYGECRSSECKYVVRVPITGVVKPWIVSSSTKQHGCEKRYVLDCSGFSIAEFQMLDIGKMDLKEFEDSIKSKLKSDLPDSDSYKSTAIEAAKRGQRNANQKEESQIPEGDPAVTYYSAWLSEGEVFLSELVTANAKGEWPQAGSGNLVESAKVSWGDGSSSTMRRNNGDFIGTHSYDQKGSYNIIVTQRMPDGSEHVKQLVVDVQDPDAPFPGLGGSPF